jgi:hypothetical protein
MNHASNERRKEESRERKKKEKERLRGSKWTFFELSSFKALP